MFFANNLRTKPLLLLFHHFHATVSKNYDSSSMKTISLAKIQTDFHDIFAGIEVGEEILISSAETEKVVAVIVPYEAWQKKQSMATKPGVLGTLHNRGSVEFADDFAMTDEELLQS